MPISLIDELRRITTLVNNARGWSDAARAAALAARRAHMKKPVDAASLFRTKKDDTHVPHPRETVAAPNPAGKKDVMGHTPAMFARWMGKNNVSFDDAKKVMKHHGVEMKDVTLKTYLSDGKSGKYGAAANVTPEQEAQFKNILKQEPDFPPLHVEPAPPSKPKEPKKPAPPSKPKEPKKPDSKGSEVPKLSKAEILKSKPEHITFTGEPTEFTKKAWDHINSLKEDLGSADPVKRAKAVESVGEFVNAEVTKRIGGEKLEGLQKEYETARAVYYGPKPWDMEERKKDQEKYDAAMRAYSDEKERVTKARQVMTLQVMSEIRDMGGENHYDMLSGRAAGYQTKGAATPKMLQQMKEATRLFPTDWLKTAGEKMQVGVVDIGAFKEDHPNVAGLFIEDSYVEGARAKGKRSAVIAIPSKKTRGRPVERIAAHEMMHSMEWAHYLSSGKKLGETVRAHLVERAKDAGKPPTPQPWYKGSDIQVIAGASGNGYVGRVYEDSTFHEVLSTGIENIFFSSLEEDKRTHHFTVGTMMSI